MSFTSAGIGLAILSNALLIFFTRQYSDSKQPISISLNATKITSNQVSLQWNLHSSSNAKPSEISIETTKLNDTIHISTDVVDFSMQKYSIRNLDEKTDYSVCLMTKKKGKILAKECINVTTLPRAEEHKAIVKSDDVIALSSILGFSSFFGVLLTLYMIYGRVIRSRLKGYTRQRENHVQYSQKNGVENVNLNG